MATKRPNIVGLKDQILKILEEYDSPSKSEICKILKDGGYTSNMKIISLILEVLQSEKQIRCGYRGVFYGKPYVGYYLNSPSLPTEDQLKNMILGKLKGEIISAKGLSLSLGLPYAFVLATLDNLRKEGIILRGENHGFYLKGEDLCVVRSGHLLVYFCDSSTRGNT